MDVHMVQNAREFLTHALVSISEIGRLMSMRSATLLNKKVTYADLSDVSGILKANEKIQGIVSIAKNNLDNVAEGAVKELNELLESLGEPPYKSNTTRKKCESETPVTNGEIMCVAVNNEPKQLQEEQDTSLPQEKDTQGTTDEPSYDICDSNTPLQASTNKVESIVCNTEDAAKNGDDSKDLQHENSEEEQKPILKLVDINKLMDPKVSKNVKSTEDTSVIILSDSDISSPEKCKDRLPDPKEKLLIEDHGKEPVFNDTVQLILNSDHRYKPESSFVNLIKLPLSLKRMMRKHNLQKVLNSEGEIVGQIPKGRAENSELDKISIRGKRAKTTKDVAKIKFEAFRKTRTEHARKKKEIVASSGSDEKSNEDAPAKGSEVPEFEEFDKSMKKSSLKDHESPRVNKHVSFASVNNSSDSDNNSDKHSDSSKSDSNDVKEKCSLKADVETVQKPGSDESNDAKDKSSESKSDNSSTNEEGRRIQRKTKSERNKKSKLRQNLDTSNNDYGESGSDSNSDTDEGDASSIISPSMTNDLKKTDIVEDDVNNIKCDQEKLPQKSEEKEVDSGDGVSNTNSDAEVPHNLDVAKEQSESDVPCLEKDDEKNKRKRTDSGLSDDSNGEDGCVKKKKSKVSDVDEDIDKLTNLKSLEKSLGGKTTTKSQRKKKSKDGDEINAGDEENAVSENDEEASEHSDEQLETNEACEESAIVEKDCGEIQEKVLKEILHSSDENSGNEKNDSDKSVGDDEDKKKEKKLSKLRAKPEDAKNSKNSRRNISDPLLNEKLSESDSDETDKKKKKGTNKKLSDEEDDEIRSDKGSFKKSRLKKNVVASSSDEETSEQIEKTEEKSNAEKSDNSDKDAVRDSSDDSDIKIKKKSSSIDSDSETSIKNSEKEDDKKNDSDSDSDVIPSKRRPKRKPQSDDSDSSKSSDSTKKTKRRRIKKPKGDSSAESGSDADSPKGRKNIRKVIKNKNLEEATKQAAKEEKERKQRIEERQKLYNSLFDDKHMQESKVEKLVLDFDPETKKELIVVHKKIVKQLKPHQANGIKFMFDACFESVKQIDKGYGSGCILAHCMGLGKSLQVVGLVHTLLTHSELTKVRCVLVVCPLSTVLNWVNEFKIWLKNINDGEDVNIFELSRYKKNVERTFQLKDWQNCGGVMIMSYELFRNLTNEKGNRIRKKMKESLQKSLVDPGPDMVVCDEGHLLKNEKTSLSQAMTRIKTARRIVLTGTPVQNNLKEYYCMMQFVKPNLLGKYTEYLNRFVNPITNGQYTDSTPRDIEIMKRRSHVLHKMLDGCVQRRDYGVLAPFLPPKHEYVLFINLTELQIKLYQFYLDNFARRVAPDRKNSSFLFPDFQNFQRIWTHPRAMKANSEKYERVRAKKLEMASDSEGSLKDFIDDSNSESEEKTTSDDSGSEDSDDNRNKKKKNNALARNTRASRRMAGAGADPVEQPEPLEQEKIENPTEWWMPLCPEEELDYIKHSSKLILLFDILKECEAIGDKILVFSQSLYSLDVIEHFLTQIDEVTQHESTDSSDEEGSSKDKLLGHRGSWTLGLDYFRLDGSSSCENRASWCKSFNKTDNYRARLFLISTRAGGLGINLFAANRVIIFDVSWNPSHDIQSIFRVYRFGQKKPCYIYRFIARGTMEEKVYERQVTKQAISKRVIDEQQIDRHYNSNDLNELYKFEPVAEEPRPVPNLPKDRLCAELLKSHEKLIYRFHEHDSLLENKEEETLNEEERRAAWEEFENEKKLPPPNQFGGKVSAAYGTSATIFGMRTDLALSLITVILRQDYPTLADEQIKSLIPTVYQKMIADAEVKNFTILNRMYAILEAQQQLLAANNSASYSHQQPAQQQLYNAGRPMPTWMQQQQQQQQQMRQMQQMQQQQLQMQQLNQQQMMMKKNNQVPNPFSHGQSVLRAQNSNLVPNPLAGTMSSKSKRKLPTLDDFVDLDSD